MSNPFSSYRLIPAEAIIRSNIRPDQINEDLKSLINTLTALKYLTKSKLSEGSSLNPNIVVKLAEKNETLTLLYYFGYRRKNLGEYVYQSSTSGDETDKRRNGVDEFVKFYDYLKGVKSDSLNDLERFIQNSSRPSSTDSNRDSYYNPTPKSLSPRSNFVPPPSPPDQREIDQSNAKTLETVESLKKSLVTQYNTSPTQSFTRRKLAILLFKQKNPNSIEAGDDFIDQTVDQKIRSLKQTDKQTNVPRTDDIYIECLIRSNFDETKALEILRHKRPNLVPLIEQPVPIKLSSVLMDNSIQHLRQHWNLLNQRNNEDNFTGQLSPDSDKWKNIKHLVPAIQQLQLKNNTKSSDEAFLSRMYRLLYSELLHIIGQQLPVKIESLAAILCELSSDSIENLDMATIKNILCSSDDFNEGFGSHAINSLSIKCPICDNSFPRTQMETMLLCSHECCLDCIKNYYRNNIYRIGDAQSLNKLTCFMEEHEIIEDQKLDFFICLDSKLRQWFHDEPDILDRYHRNVFTAASDGHIRKCGSSKCLSYFAADDNEDIDRVFCPDCQFAQCRQCRRKWYPEHTEMECDEYEEWLIDYDPEDPDVQVLNYLSATAVVCPKEGCPGIYEYKAGGCEHFTCLQCQTDFCRMCSALFYLPSKEVKCPRVNCLLKNTLHAHCCSNCFRETRIGEIDVIIALLNDRSINVTEELQKKPVSTDKICPVEDCVKATSAASGDRLCEMCYKQFLCSLIWRHEIEPWEVYEDNNLQQMLNKASVAIPANATREDLLQLCKQNLNQFLGKPKKLKKPRS